MRLEFESSGASCHSACNFDPLMECAPGAGQVEISDLTG